MKRIEAIAMLALLSGGCVASPNVAPAGKYDDFPKYGDAKRETIWSRTPAAERDRLVALSADASERGWLLLREGDLTTALKRFNLSWSLNPQNANALWGMAIVQFERAKRTSSPNPTDADLGNLNFAVSLIDEAAALPSPEGSLLNDAAMIVMTRGKMREHRGQKGASSDFDRAETLLRRAEAIEAHPLVYENWASLERYRGRPGAAAGHAEKARQLRGGSFGEQR